MVISVLILFTLLNDEDVLVLFNLNLFCNLFNFNKILSLENMVLLLRKELFLLIIFLLQFIVVKLFESYNLI